MIDSVEENMSKSVGKNMIDFVEKNNKIFSIILLCYFLFGLYTFGYCYSNKEIQKECSYNGHTDWVAVGFKSTACGVLWPFFWTIELQWQETCKE